MFSADGDAPLLSPAQGVPASAKAVGSEEDSSADAADLADPAHRRQLALAIAVGILNYLRVAG